MSNKQLYRVSLSALKPTKCGPEIIGSRCQQAIKPFDIICDMLNMTCLTVGFAKYHTTAFRRMTVALYSSSHGNNIHRDSKKNWIFVSFRTSSNFHQT